MAGPEIRKPTIERPLRSAPKAKLGPARRLMGQEESGYTVEWLKDGEAIHSESFADRADALKAMKKE